MPYELSITPDADRQLRGLTSYEQRIIEAGMVARLLHQKLKPNSFAEFELRLGDYRILYNVEEQATRVVIKAIGRKVKNQLVVEGREFHEHESSHSERANGERGGPAD